MSIGGPGKRTERERAILLLALGLGIALRFALPFAGSNYDLESYHIVADIVSRGGNVYAETPRYNYGPLWFGVLGALGSFDDPAAFRLGIVAILTAADIAIAAWALRRFGLWPALIFFLNPVSIIITGYHNQFDNVAIAIGLWALTIGERRFLLGLGLLGLSLVVKHLFFLMPLWLAFRADGLRNKALALAVPVGIFLASFLPFAAEGADGILRNVFLYRSFHNGLIYAPLGDLKQLLSPTLIFIAGLAALGWAFRGRAASEAGLLYLVALVLLSPAATNQYLAIPMAAVAVWPNIWFRLYVLTATLLLAVSPDGLHIAALGDALGGFAVWLGGRQGYWLPVLMLLIGFIIQRKERRAAP